MISQELGGAIVYMMISFSAFIIAALLIVFLWARKRGYFKGQDEARFLPLKSGIPESPKTNSKQPEKKHV